MNRKYIVLGSLAIFLIAAIVLIINSNSSSSTTTDPKDEVVHRGVAGDPRDIVLDFYELWRERKLATTTDDSTVNPVASEALSYKMIDRLQNFDFASSSEGVDPVFCQTTIPEQFRSKYIYQDEASEQLIISSKDKTIPGQAIVTIDKFNDLWEISDISCSGGEVAPPMGEFSFENEGFMLRDSLPAKFDKTHWHLVFTQDNEPGHTVPLMLDGESMCVGADGGESVCSADNFKETQKIFAQGQMAEAGLQVKRIRTIETE